MIGVSQLKIKITTAPGFTIVGKPIIFPDKVKIAGSRNIVETISFVETISDTIINSNSPISINLSLLIINSVSTYFLTLLIRP